MIYFLTHSWDSTRDTLDKYSAELKMVADCLLGFMANNLGLTQEKHANLFNNGHQSVRINYYPPCSHANKVLGLSSHSDSVGLTLLLQVKSGWGAPNQEKWWIATHQPNSSCFHCQHWRYPWGTCWFLFNLLSLKTVTSCLLHKRVG